MQDNAGQLGKNLKKVRTIQDNAGQNPKVRTMQDNAGHLATMPGYPPGIIGEKYNQGFPIAMTRERT